MTSHIRILPEEICNKIAAGEVVERPSSVVKELLENSLDAGAGEVRVDIRAGGRRLIRIVDDGEGMSRDDLFLALERHATSKLSSDEDLFRLRTLGFRGEALPSIASVSRLTLRSCPANSLEGFEIQSEGGVVKHAGVTGMARGTCIEASDLFFNTPARRKFLRRDETEFGHIADVVTKLALAHPEVHFRLEHNGKTIFDAFRQGTLAARVADLLGRPLLRDLLPLDISDGGLRLHGMISTPETNRSGTGAIYTFINGRYIRDRVVQHALLDGYRSVLEKGRYPVAILFLEMPPEEVDVNVHPTKHEVRFREQGRVHSFLSGAVRQCLKPVAWLEEAHPVAPEPTTAPPAPQSTAPIMPASAVNPYRHGVQEAMESYGRRMPTVAAPASFFSPHKATPAEAENSGFFGRLTLLGQYRRSYLLCQDGDDLVLIDQHAAHERIGFERLKKEYRDGVLERQALLFPAVIEFDYRESALLKENLAELARLGFELEPFGGRSLALKTIPRLLGEIDSERLLREVAEELAAVGKSSAVESAIEKVLAVIACHGAIRANRSLSPPEISSLLDALDQVDFKISCPHGRPVMKRLSIGEIERMFRRT
ncbi:MAG: DNA mismatch repair endonuclease MutL [Desulfuromonadales bacterium]